MSTAATIVAALLLGQAATDRVTAVYPDEPVTWTLEYPNLIGIFVEDYYSCLRSGDYAIGVGTSFKAQYIGDIDRCSANGAELQRAANERLQARGNSDTSEADVAQIFETVRQIHVARGASLDQAISTRLSASANVRTAAEASGEVDRECVAKIDAMRAQRDELAATRGPEVAAIYAKEEYSDQDKRDIFAYTSGLARLTKNIEVALQYCPQAMYAPPAPVAQK